MISTRTQEFSQFLAVLEEFETKVWNEHQKMYEDCAFDEAVDAMREAMQYLICASIMEDGHTAYENKRAAHQPSGTYMEKKPNEA